MSFVELLEHSEYEIMTEYPFTIRRKSDGFKPTETVDTAGYIRVKLNGKQYKKHILIAKQFILNDDPEHKTQVDHINHDRSDYHLSNLRWVTPSQNQQNRSSSRGVVYEFVDDLPDESMVVDFYDTRNDHHEFDGYFFHDDVFFRFNGLKYRVLHVNENKSGSKFVSMRDINNKLVSVTYTKFKQQHDLM